MRLIKDFTARNRTILTWSLFVFVISAIVFLVIAKAVVTNHPLSFDNPTLLWFHAHANSFFDSFFLVTTNVGSVMSMLAVAAILSLFLLYKKQYRNIILLLGSVGGASVLNIILKQLFHRTRPDLWHGAVVETDFSFPSGHAMLSSALVLALIIILWRTRYKLSALILGVLAIVLVGLSRLYFGVHYPSDIIAGWCVSLIWVMMFFYVWRVCFTRLDRDRARLA